MKSRLALAFACSLACGVGLLMPSEASAFCGFYVAGADAKLFNDATVVVLMRDGTRTVLSMQNNYQGPPEAFALVIPVPVVLKESDVEVLREELFDRVDTLAAPRLVEYWEIDPCANVTTIGLGNIGSGGPSLAGYGRGGGGDDSTVKVEAQFAVGEYDIAILSATESSGLDTWLRDNGYNIPAGAEPLLRPYVQQDMKFFVAKVDPKKVKFAGNGRAKLSPLRFHYDSKDFTLPVRLGLINAPDPSTGGKQDLLVHILAPERRYQLANYPNATIPTNLDVTEMTKERFGEFYVSLFDHTLEQNPGAVVTEYAWGAGSCDPCPGPAAALTNQELLELGADVLPNWATAAATQTRSAAFPPEIQQFGAGRQVAKAHFDEVRSCYTAGLAKDPTLAGRVELEFTIAASVKVVSSSVAKTMPGDTTVGECIAKAAKRWTFPKPAGGESVHIDHAIRFAPGMNGNWGASAAGGFVLTRLHARYDASSLGEDLVFEAAPAIVGGRETVGEPERGATIVEGEGTNNFQARYAMRHAWAGEIACASPMRGRWGGPPKGGDSQPTLARQLGDAARGASLGSFVTVSAGEQIGIAATAIVAEDPPEVPKPAEQTASEPAGPASGCACSSESHPQLPNVASLALLALLGLRRRDPGSSW